MNFYLIFFFYSTQDMHTFVFILKLRVFLSYMIAISVSSKSDKPAPVNHFTQRQAVARKTRGQKNL